jgi:hypothetical protein
LGIGTARTVNSAVVAIAVMLGNLLFCSMAGHGLAKFRFPYREASFRAILSTLMLPLEIVLVPTYLVVRGLGLVNNYGGLIVPLAVDAFGIFLMPQYIKDLPDSLMEAARLDGWQRARHLRARRPAELQAGSGHPRAADLPRQLGPVPVAADRGLAGHPQELSAGTGADGGHRLRRVSRDHGHRGDPHDPHEI